MPGGLDDAQADRVSKGSLKKARVLLLFDTDGEPPASQDYKKQIESTDEAEFDVARALLAKGHQVRLFGFRDNLEQLIAGLRAEPADVVFNLAERFRGESAVRLHGRGRAGDAGTPLHGRVVRRAHAGAGQGPHQEGVRLPGDPDPALHGVPARRGRAAAERSEVPAHREAPRRGRVGRYRRRPRSCATTTRSRNG